MEMGVDIGSIEGGTLVIRTASIEPISTPISIVVEQAKRLMSPCLNCSSKSRSRCGGCCALCSSARSEEHTSELQSLMRISYAVLCLKKKNTNIQHSIIHTHVNHIH